MNTINRAFLKGLLTVLPITITIYLVVWIVKFAESLFGEPLREILPEATYVPGLGLIIALLAILGVGVLVNHYIASRFVSWLEETLQRVPFFKAIYNPLRDVMNLFAADHGQSLKRVVIVDLPHVGCSVVGLVTRDRFEDLSISSAVRDHLAVFVPFSYAVGGITILVPKSQVREVGLSPEKAMQLAITAWIKVDKQSSRSAKPDPKEERLGSDARQEHG